MAPRSEATCLRIDTAPHQAVTGRGPRAGGGTIFPDDGFYAVGDSQVADETGTMRSPNQIYMRTPRPSWGSDAHYAENGTALLHGADAHVAFYRREAQRLIGLAAASSSADAKRQFLSLAQQYEMLAEHAARRVVRGV